MLGNYCFPGFWRLALGVSLAPQLPAAQVVQSPMILDQLVGQARALGASDLHLEASLPAAVRVHDHLRTLGEPIPGRALAECAQQLLSGANWTTFLERRSFDFSRTIAGIRC